MTQLVQHNCGGILQEVHDHRRESSGCTAEESPTVFEGAILTVNLGKYKSLPGNNDSYSDK